MVIYPFAEQKSANFIGCIPDSKSSVNTCYQQNPTLLKRRFSEPEWAAQDCQRRPRGPKGEPGPVSERGPSSLHMDILTLADA